MTEYTDAQFEALKDRIDLLYEKIGASASSSEIIIRYEHAGEPQEHSCGGVFIAIDKNASKLYAAFTANYERARPYVSVDDQIKYFDFEMNDLPTWAIPSRQIVHTTRSTTNATPPVLIGETTLTITPTKRGLHISLDWSPSTGGSVGYSGHGFITANI